MSPPRPVPAPAATPTTVTQEALCDVGDDLQDPTRGDELDPVEEPGDGTPPIRVSADT
jgi:hypothetical protein